MTSVLLIHHDKALLGVIKQATAYSEDWRKVNYNILQSGTQSDPDI